MYAMSDATRGHPGTKESNERGRRGTRWWFEDKWLNVNARRTRVDFYKELGLYCNSAAIQRHIRFVLTPRCDGVRTLLVSTSRTEPASLDNSQPSLKNIVGVLLSIECIAFALVPLNLCTDMHNTASQGLLMYTSTWDVESTWISPGRRGYAYRGQIANLPGEIYRSHKRLHTYAVFEHFC